MSAKPALTNKNIIDQDLMNALVRLKDRANKEHQQLGAKFTENLAWAIDTLMMGSGYVKIFYEGVMADKIIKCLETGYTVKSMLLYYENELDLWYPSRTNSSLTNAAREEYYMALRKIVGILKHFK